MAERCWTKQRVDKTNQCWWMDANANAKPITTSYGVNILQSSPKDYYVVSNAWVFSGHLDCQSWLDDRRGCGQHLGPFGSLEEARAAIERNVSTHKPITVRVLTGHVAPPPFMDAPMPEEILDAVDENALEILLEFDERMRLRSWFAPEA